MLFIFIRIVKKEKTDLRPVIMREYINMSKNTLYQILLLQNVQQEILDQIAYSAVVDTV